MEKSKSIIVICLMFILVACSADRTLNNESNDSTKEVAEADPVELDITDYGKEVGFTMEAPPSEVRTTFSLVGEMDQAADLKDDYVWVKVRKLDRIEEIDSREIEYYIPLNNGQFSKEINLPNGAGDYSVTVRVPSKDKENYFHDSVKFNMINLDETIARDVEYTRYGLEKELQMGDAVNGWNEATEVFTVEGTVADGYEETALLAEVQKDGNKSTIAIPIQEGSFKGEIPLYYGKGTHKITMQLYSDDEKDRDGYYYHAAEFHVHNDSNEILPEITQSGPYIDRGLMLEQPGAGIETELHEIEYPVKGRINPDAPLADSVSHIIVEMHHLDNSKDKATYYFPVTDYKFEGTAHFRFGSGEYKVTVYVPNEEQKRKNEFHFTSAYEVIHEVKDIEDKRDLLPSRGVESDDLIIVEQAEEITDGLSTEREKAKSIFEFVAKHVAYDVEKFKEDIFHPDDSALATLSSGSGICQDYAFLTLALLRSIDIESRYVQGYAGGRHAWVEAKVDGEWIEMDPTWGAGYIKKNEFHFKYNEDYFDPDPDFLAETHVRQGLLY